MNGKLARSLRRATRNLGFDPKDTTRLVLIRKCGKFVHEKLTVNPDGTVKLVPVKYPKSIHGGTLAHKGGRAIYQNIKGYK